MPLFAGRANFRADKDRGVQMTPEKEMQYREMLAADREFQKALEKEYSARAGDMRYQTSNQPEFIRNLGEKYTMLADRYFDHDPRSAS